jgi:dynein heavy chain
MNTVLTQELVRFNNLVDTVSTTLRNVLLALKGTVLMSSDLDDVATSLRLR